MTCDTGTETKLSRQIGETFDTQRGIYSKESGGECQAGRHTTQTRSTSGIFDPADNIHVCPDSHQIYVLVTDGSVVTCCNNHPKLNKIKELVALQLWMLKTRAGETDRWTTC